MPIDKEGEKIVVFKPEKEFEQKKVSLGQWRMGRSQYVKDGGIILGDRALFQNGYLVDMETGKLSYVDILCKDGIVEEIRPAGSFNDETKQIRYLYEMGDGYILPNFYNAFCDSQEVFRKNFGLELDDEELKAMGKKIMVEKNVLSGVNYDNAEMLAEGVKVLQNVVEKTEEELSKLSEDVAKSGDILYLKVGQDLNELGEVDKIYKKPLPYVLEDFGFLDRNPRLVGGNCFEKDDLQFLRDSIPLYIVCPHEDAKFGRRPVNLKTLNHLGFNLAIGSGHAFEMDFFAYMRQIITSQRQMFESSDCITEKEVYQMACLYPQTLKVGDRADFIVVKEGCNLYDDVFNALVWGKSKQDIIMSVYGGKTIQVNGRLCGLLEGSFMIPEIGKLKKKIKEKKNDN
ncbi:MAG: hypothetical protein J6K39_01025 [Clostridia bacterium]|nr:hypothetical protein [Clostridia bacterium]